VLFFNPGEYAAFPRFDFARFDFLNFYLVIAFIVVGSLFHLPAGDRLVVFDSKWLNIVKILVMFWCSVKEVIVDVESGRICKCLLWVRLWVD